MLSFNLYTSAPQPIRGSDYVSQRTLCRRNKFLMQQLQNTSGHSEEASAIQTSTLVTSIEDEKRHLGKGWNTSCSNHSRKYGGYES